MKIPWIPIVGLCLAVLILAAGFVLWKKSKKVEGFETTTTAEEAALSALTSQEKEMFSKLKDNALNEKEIDRLIGSGSLTPELMEKFLDIMDL